MAPQAPGAGACLSFTLYVRSYCHLCDDMLAALEACRRGRDFQVAIVDVDGALNLEARFGERVPVLTLGDTEICHYFFNEARFNEVFDAIR